MLNGVVRRIHRQRHHSSVSFLLIFLKYMCTKMTLQATAAGVLLLLLLYSGSGTRYIDPTHHHLSINQRRRSDREGDSPRLIQIQHRGICSPASPNSLKFSETFGTAAFAVSSSIRTALELSSSQDTCLHWIKHETQGEHLIDYFITNPSTIHIS